MVRLSSLVPLCSLKGGESSLFVNFSFPPPVLIFVMGKEVVRCGNLNLRAHAVAENFRKCGYYTFLSTYKLAIALALTSWNRSITMLSFPCQLLYEGLCVIAHRFCLCDPGLERFMFLALT